MKMIKLLILTVLLTLVYSCDNQRDWARHVKRFQAPAYDMKTYGTGFNMLIKGKVYTVTNRHVCEVSHMLEQGDMAMVNGKKQTIVKMSEEHDLCIVTSDDKEGFHLAKEDVEPLDKITLIGHPRGLDLVIREGRIVSEDVDVRLRSGTYNGDRISATAYGGNSGSPVINEFGRVVGVLFAGSPAYPHEPFIVPYEALKQFVQSI